MRPAPHGMGAVQAKLDAAKAAGDISITQCLDMLHEMRTSDSGGRAESQAAGAATSSGPAAVASTDLEGEEAGHAHSEHDSLDS